MSRIFLYKEIKTDVLVAMDENTHTVRLNDEESTLEMEDIIYSKIVDGVNAVRQIAPLKYLMPVDKTFNIEFDNDESTKGKIELNNSEDILRFVSVATEDWNRPCTDFISIHDPRYEEQYSFAKGVAGNKSRPVVAIAYNKRNVILELFRTDSAQAELLYIEKEKTLPLHDYIDEPDKEDISLEEIEIENAIYKAVVYKIASLVCSTYLNGDYVGVMENLVMSELGISKEDAK